MSAIADWDWEIGAKNIANTEDWSTQFNWIEEIQVSPDGETAACIVNIDEGEFNVCVNGQKWREDPFDKIWLLRFSPDGRLTAIVSEMGEWTLAIDGEPWTNTFGYLWQPMFSKDGKVIAAAFQNDMKYGIVVDDNPWENTFSNMTCPTMNASGSSCGAAVQTVETGQGEIFTFQKGSYSVAQDGAVWDKNFVNVWDMAISDDGKTLAAEVRHTLYDYTIAVNGIPWKTIFNCVWRPIIHPKTGAVLAPVRMNGKWTLAQDGNRHWGGQFDQLFDPRVLPDGKHIAAIVAPDFGKWTIAFDSVPWKVCVDEMVTDLVINDSGSRIVALGKDHGQWLVLENGKIWNTKFNRAWKPECSPNGQYVALKVEKNGKYSLAVNDCLWNESFQAIWGPVFSQDSTKILCCTLDNGKIDRRVIPVKSILK